MSSGQGFDFFGFEWWYSFNKKTFRSFTFLERKKESDFFFKKKKEKKRRKREKQLENAAANLDWRVDPGARAIEAF